MKERKEEEWVGGNLLAGKVKEHGNQMQCAIFARDLDFKTKYRGYRDGSKLRRVYTALPDDLSLILSIQSVTPVSETLMQSSGLHGHLYAHVHRTTH